MSSEALGRLRADIESGKPGQYALVSQEDALALLAEVARLEQELERTQLDAALGRAALAVAREREQRLREALEKIARSGPVFDAKGTWSKRICDDARAALVDEPAPGVPPREERLREAIASALTSLATGPARDGYAYSVLEAALVDENPMEPSGEPAAATARKCPNCNGFGKVRDPMRVDPVTCSRCDGQGAIPAAATLAEPGGTVELNGAEAPSVEAAVATPSGSASAAADEPADEGFDPWGVGPANLAAADDGRCPGCGWYVADCNCVARAAADEPGETPA